MTKPLEFDCHLPNLLRELIEGHPSPGPLITATNLARLIFIDLAKRAIELDDPELNITMLRLSMYDVSPTERLQAIEAQRDRLERP